MADENIDHRIIGSLRQAGFAVQSVYESFRGLTDEEVIALSRQPPKLILTEDKDFGEWVFAHGIQDISVLFLRYQFAETAEMISTLLTLLQTRLPDLYGAFTTVGIYKVRIRGCRDFGQYYTYAQSPDCPAVGALYDKQTTYLRVAATYSAKANNYQLVFYQFMKS